jgi:hypothetical protein
MARNGDRRSTKKPTVASATNGNISIEVPTAKVSGFNFRDWLKLKPDSDIHTRRHHVTFFKNFGAKTLTTKEMTLPELRDLIFNTEGATKEKLPWLKLARFGKKVNPDNPKAGCLRHDGNVIGFDGIELDYDQEEMSVDEAVTIFKEMNVRVLIYPSPSHTDAAPRWRALLPVSRKLALETRGKLCARVKSPRT